MKPADRLALLQGLYRDKVALRRRHEAGAALVASYDANNAYQFAIAREEAHLDWLRRAITAMGGVPDDSADPPPLPVPRGRADAVRTVAGDDARLAAEFESRWRDRVAACSQARDRKMLELLLGEALEHQRFFAQAASGDTDLLGRRPVGAGTPGDVLAARWVG
ncbi:MAG TPA: hypothetical protein PLN93_07425 [Vicinamibacterales bacterium]|nr:hypothetical protein [Vicinamibacterales bacterium]HOQ60566.1 hypothetical protein [Vicinamibacterales bacterium]HPK71756.1 hypothetical protein [Vicinamibacterales bacterium]HPW20850.1 hypothetical protein [Vicinamibacterales bacterium]